MKRIQSFVWLLFMMLVVIAGCGTQPTPQIVRETVPVLVTVIIPQTVEVTREVTVVITATPTPRPTATPAPTATVTPAVIVPAGWVTYTHPAGLFTVMVPPDARIVSEDEDSVAFAQPGQSGLIVGVTDDLRQIVGDEDSINEMVAGMLDSTGSLDTTKAIDKGYWTTPVAANYFEWSILDYVYKDTSYRFMLVMPVAGRATIMATTLRWDRPLSDQQKSDLGIIASTIRLNGQ